MGKRGFAAMDPERVRAIAAAGGRAAHARGTAHRFTTEEAQVAGRKGGLARRPGAKLQATLPYSDEDPEPVTQRAPYLADIEVAS